MEEISLFENFDHGLTGWPNYDVYDASLRPVIHGQRHVDLFHFRTLAPRWQILDDFRRPDGAMGVNWAPKPYGVFNSFIISNGRAVPASSGETEMYWAPGNPGATAVRVTVESGSTNGGEGPEIGFAFNPGSLTSAGYFAEISVDGADVGNDAVTFYRHNDDGSFTNFGTSPIGRTLVPPYDFEFHKNGDTMTAVINGEVVGTATDSTYSNLTPPYVHFGSFGSTDWTYSNLSILSTTGESWSVGTMAPRSGNANLPSLQAGFAGPVDIMGFYEIGSPSTPDNPTHTNLIANPSFETDMTGWTSYAGNPSRVTTEHDVGSAAAQLEIIGFDNPFLDNRGALIPVTPGATYSGMFRVKSSVARSCHLFFSWKDAPTADFTALSTILGASVVSSTSEWTTVKIENQIAPADANWLMIGCTIESQVANELHYIDSVMVVQEPSLPTYFDGDTFGYQWTGTPHESTSIGPLDFQLASLDLGGFADDDHFSIALPSFPLASLDLSLSTVSLTSNPTGNFTVGPTKTWTMAESAVPLMAGDSEFRVPISALQDPNFDLSKVTAIQFHLEPTGSGTFEVNAVRCLAQTWESSGADTDTLDETYCLRPNRTGGLVTDFDQPILWRSAIPAGTNDPRPIDAGFVVPFNSGLSAGHSRITLYFRELTEDFLTQLDLDGMTMAKLDGKVQPDVGDAKYNPRTVGEISQFKQGDLEGETMFSLERTPDFLSASWIEFTIQWGATNQITIQDTEGNGYNFIFPTLTEDSKYAFSTFLEENKARAILYSLDDTGAVTGTIFDTSLIDDDTSFKRRKGRFGWFASFSDADAYVDAVIPNGLTFAEYRSLPFASQTPVIGAELFASNSPSIELFTTAVTRDIKVNTVVPDTSKSLSGQSWRVHNQGNVTDPGLITNVLSLTDFENSVLEFDAWVPGTALQQGLTLEAKMINNQGATYDLVLPRVVGDQWQHVTANFIFDEIVLPGFYQIEIVLGGNTGDTLDWWADNISVKRRTVVWDGRSVVDDPWKSNNAKWQPFRDNLSKESGGIVFDRRGSDLQVRGRARTHGANISRVQYKPKYAEPGLIVKPYTPPETRFTNMISNPNGDTLTGWATDTGYSAVLSSVTDSGKPALQNVTPSGHAVTITSRAASVPYQAGYKYFIAAEVRKQDGGNTSGINLDYIVWNDAGTNYFEGRYSFGVYGIVSTFPEDPNNYRTPFLYTDDNSWYTVWGIWSPNSANFAGYASALGQPFNNPRIGFEAELIGSGTSPATMLIRRATLVALPPGYTIVPTGPFDGDSPQAVWLNTPPPSYSQLIFHPFTPDINPIFAATNVGREVTFTASADTPIANFEWNFGDGYKGFGTSVVHTYGAAGTYPVTLVATDLYGNQDVYTNTVAV